MRVLRRLPLRMPLHGQGELLGARQMNRFNQTILGMGQRLDTVTQLVQGLTVQRIDREIGLAHQLGKPATRHRTHAVAVGILHVHRRAGVFTVIIHARYFVDLLVDIAAEGHVDFLHATADRKQRQATGQRRANQWNIKQITVFILTLGWGQVFLAVEGRIDIAARTGQVHAIDHRQVLVDVVGTAATGRQQRHTARQFDQGGYVFVRHDLIGMPFALLCAHGHQDNRFTRAGALFRIVVGHTSPWGSRDWLPLLCRRADGCRAPSVLRLIAPV